MTEQLNLDFGRPPPGPRAGETSPHPTAPCVVRELARVRDRSPLGRKLLVGRTRGEGRELLRQLGRTQGAWSGFEPTTVRPLAVEVAAGSLAAEGIRLLDEFDVRALVDASVDRMLERSLESPFHQLADGVGLRERLFGAISALRLGGIASARLGTLKLENGAKLEALVGFLAEYERRLVRASAADTASVLARAAALLESDDLEALLPDTSVYILPGALRHGLAGRVLAVLQRLGAEVLAGDPVAELDPPARVVWRSGPEKSQGSFLHAPSGLRPDTASMEALHVFSAANVTDELREVLRRALAMGLTWDQVEILTPDPQVYGSALHALAERLEVPVTFGVGLPLERTRPGRAVAEYLRWIEGGFSADHIRRMLEAGDLRPPPKYRRLLPMTLARRFRSLRIGWGRDRYGPAIQRALAGLNEAPRHRYESEAGLERRRARWAAELRALRAIFRPVLRATPPVPPPTGVGPSLRVSPGALAEGLRTFLRFVPAEHPVDVTAAERLDRVLARVAATQDRKTEYAWAASALRRHLDFRVPAPEAEGKAPWSSSGGHLYLTDLEHGGTTGRAATFVVGMDAGRFPGGGIEDPLLLDRDRMRIGGDVLRTTREQIAERRFAFAALLARLRGTVTVSYCAWDPAEARELSPASEVLQVFRLKRGDPTLTFEDLRRHLGRAVGVLPERTMLDGQDVWMRTLVSDDTLLSGTHAVRAAFPRLNDGLKAFDALDGDEPSPYLGMLESRAELDPRLNPERVLSASRLEALGTCPRRFLFGSVLGLRPPDDPRYDPDVWLDHLARGSLLHRVYERALREARASSMEEESSAFEARALAIFAEEADRALLEHPTPSASVRDRQLREMREDVRSFVRMVRERGASWLGLEVRFGLGDAPAVPLPVPGGEVPLRGIIDRVDDAEDGLVVIDYKTGSPFAYGAETGVFRDARRLQHVVYVVAAQRLFGRPAARMEYHFPTRRAENRIVGFPERALRLGPAVVGHLMDSVREGNFVPTDRADDCKFCDYRAICRVREDEWRIHSPFAEWAKEHGTTLDAFKAVNRARKVEDEGFGLVEPPPLGEPLP